MSNQSERNPTQSPPGAPDWRRFGRGTVVPILLLVALLVLLGRMHIDLATGYTAPRLVLDENGGFLFYDGGSRDAGFFLRRVRDQSKKFGKRRWVKKGTVAAAALTDDQLVTLYSGRKDEDWFYSVSQRKTLVRTWNGGFSDHELQISSPRHVASLGSAVYAFGTDTKGSLRVAKLNKAGVLTPTPPKKPAELEEAAFVKDKQGVKEEAPVEPPHLFASASDGKQLFLFWRVAKEKRSSGVPPGEVRWATFDGQAFGKMRALPQDLATVAVGYSRGQLRVYGIPHGVRDDKIRVYTPEGEGFSETETLTYKREGLTGGAGVVALATGTSHGREFLFAQIGATIRYRIHENERWSEWKDLARRPAEQTAVVYGWFLSLLFLSGLLIYNGFMAWRHRGPGSRPPPVVLPPLAAEATGDPAASGEAALATIPERALAFLLDFGLVLAAASFLSFLAPDLVAPEALEAEPRARLVLLTFFMLFLLGYFIVFEALFARTPGKRLMGLEVQMVDGGRPSLPATIYRNLFRIELMLPPPWIVPMLCLLIMVGSPLHQRPGDLVARTTVRRTRPQEVPGLQPSVGEEA